MAQIPRKLIDNYTRALNKLSSDIKEKLGVALARIDLSDVADARDAIIDVMELYLGPYTDMAAVLAAEFYDGLREMSIGSKMGAFAESCRSPEATSGAVRAFMQDVVEGKPREVLVDNLLARADSEIKRASNECIAYNAQNDRAKVKYARVPSGADTCGFCIMLASRGAVYKDKEMASHAHPNCDCRVVPDFGDGIQGYDPGVYYDMWKHPEKYAGQTDKGFRYDDVSSRFVPEKLSQYSMDSEKSPSKASAWKSALGYTKNDAKTVENLILKELPGKKMHRNGYNGYGALYYTDVTIRGKNGKSARVRTSWIVEEGSDDMRLTSVYVKKKGGVKNGD